LILLVDSIGVLTIGVSEGGIIQGNQVRTARAEGSS
jgi:hypothetical protein